ncbi:mitochondrial intermembrane space Erv1 [Tribonema minus]|uniref:Sulfhydryl oxidase n=1 Tax=Tribonema minus TaxID=303371 RepID=A0A835ZFE3_9STRA|nr:mitochondrial intermembrane space Erv1 [Tribonema minus]
MPGPQMPRPEDCPDVACSDKTSMLLKMVAKGPKGTAAKPSDHAPSQLAVDKAAAAVAQQQDCPLDRRELGNATWALLHTTAAKYPEEPNADQQTAAKQLISSLSVLYPCSYCASDFRHEVANTPPKVTSRMEFSLWLCMQHNIVNRKLNQPEFKCDMKTLDERWRYGHPGCFPSPGAVQDSGVEGTDATGP